MEIFELRYFLGVARTENIHRASEKLHVSPGSLSKAIARIEAEVGARLFAREGRNIRLTEQGHYLKGRAIEILRLEESARLEIAGHRGKVRAVIAGPEALLCHFGLDIFDQIAKRHPESHIEYLSCNDEQAIDKVRAGDAHLAIVTGAVPPGLRQKELGHTKFKVVVGKGHSLYTKAREGQSISVKDVLKYGFVSPVHASLGQVGPHQSADGWRDDQFPRKITFRTLSLTLLERMVYSGRAIAYLPAYLADVPGLATLKIIGCPYSCAQTISMVAYRPEEVGWMDRLFD